MRPLKLFGLDIGMRMKLVGHELKETSASAYIYYQDKKHPNLPLDHNGQAVPTFTIRERVKALEHNLREVIWPKIEAGLRDTPFTVIDIDYTNQAPHPHLVIARKDRDALQDGDLMALNKHLENIIEKLNKKPKSNHLFSTAANQAAAPEHQYNLRNRR